MSNTLGSITTERHHNSTGNQPGAIARLELLVEEFFIPIFIF
jgi:hypothetical protein